MPALPGQQLSQGREYYYALGRGVFRGNPNADPTDPKRVEGWKIATVEPGVWGAEAIAEQIAIALNFQTKIMNRSTGE